MAVLKTLKDVIETATVNDVKIASYDQTRPKFRQVGNSLEDILCHVLSEGRVVIFPDIRDLILPQMLKTLTEWTQDSNGLLCIGNIISSSVQSKAISKPESVVTDMLLLLKNHPPVIITVVSERSDTDEKPRLYNLSLTREVTDSLLGFTSENFSILPILLTVDDFQTSEKFGEVLRENVKNLSKFHIAGSLRMTEGKSKKLAFDYLTSISTTDTVHGSCTWFLTKQQFSVLTSGIDHKEVTVTVGASCGGRILLMEVAQRLEKLGPTLLLLWGDKHVYAIRAKGLCSFIFTRKELREKMDKEDSFSVTNIVTNRQCDELSSVRCTGSFWCFKEEKDGMSNQQLCELRDRTYEDLRAETQWMLRSHLSGSVLKLIKENKKWISLRGDMDSENKRAAYFELAELEKSGQEIYLIHKPEEFYIIKENVQTAVVMVSDVFGKSKNVKKWDFHITQIFKETVKGICVILLIHEPHSHVSCHDLLDERMFREMVHAEAPRRESGPEEKMRHLNYWLKQLKISIPDALKTEVCSKPSAIKDFSYGSRMFAELKSKDATCDIKNYFADPMLYLNAIIDVFASTSKTMSLLKQIIINNGELLMKNISQKGGQVLLYMMEFILKIEDEAVMFRSSSICSRTVVIICDKDVSFLQQNCRNPLVMKCMTVKSSNEKEIEGSDHFCQYIPIYPTQSIFTQLVKTCSKEIQKQNFSIISYDLFDSQRFLTEVFKKLKIEDKNFDLDKEDSEGMTLLHKSTVFHKMAVMEMLLDMGADKTKPDRNGHMPIHTLCQQSTDNLSIKFVSVLIKNQQDASILDSHGKTPLHLAVETKFFNVDLIEYLVQLGAPGDAKDSSKQTPLHILCGRKYFQGAKTPDEKDKISDLSCKALGKVLQNADVNISGPNDNKPLHVLCKENSGRTDMINILLSKGAKTNGVGEHRATPLHLLCAQKEVCHDAVVQLLEKGASVNESDIFGVTPLHYLCMNGSYKTLKVILKYVENMDIKVSDGKDLLHGMTPLHLACVTAAASLDVVEALLEKKASIHVRDERGRTALHFICQSRMQFNFDKHNKWYVNYRNDNNMGVREREKIVHHLLKSDTQMKKKDLCDMIDQNGRTVLHYLCMLPEMEISQELLQGLLEETDLTICDSQGLTCLHYLVLNKAFGLLSLPEAKRLKEIINMGVCYPRGQNLEAEESKLLTRPGQTALHLACFIANSTCKLVHSLLHLGIDVAVKDCSGKIAIDYIDDDPVFIDFDHRSQEFVKTDRNCKPGMVKDERSKIKHVLSQLSFT